MIGVPGAVANAIAAATRACGMKQLPMTPERVWRALARNDGDRERAGHALRDSS